VSNGTFAILCKIGGGEKGEIKLMADDFPMVTIMSRKAGEYFPNLLSNTILRQPAFLGEQ
jgi:hypothetical protein